MIVLLYIFLLKLNFWIKIKKRFTDSHAIEC